MKVVLYHFKYTLIILELTNIIHLLNILNKQKRKVEFDTVVQFVMIK